MFLQTYGHFRVKFTVVLGIYNGIIKYIVRRMFFSVMLGLMPVIAEFCQMLQRQYKTPPQ